MQHRNDQQPDRFDSYNHSHSLFPKQNKKENNNKNSLMAQCYKKTDFSVLATKITMTPTTIITNVFMYGYISKYVCIY